MSSADNATNSLQRCALIMAGGTGGHIFPGLAVAEELQARGWRVVWLGGRSGSTPDQPSMEGALIPTRGFAFEAIDFTGVRGKGLLTLLTLPLRLLRAFWQSLAIVRRVRPDVVIGFGGYVSFPGGMIAVLLGKPLVLHEQNAVAGMVNKVMAHLADAVFTAFPDVLKKAQWSGNPLRSSFTGIPGPVARFANRSGPLSVLVLGGSLGATALNTVVPQALALMPKESRPQVLHQSGARHLETLRANYAAAGVAAELTAFIDDTASAFANADLVICRAGASTVTEIAAVGAAALFVPFPAAVDDHQTRNALHLADRGAGWLQPQSEFTPEWLAGMLQKTERLVLMNTALKAKSMQKTEAVGMVVAVCEALAEASLARKRQR